MSTVNIHFGPAGMRRWKELRRRFALLLTRRYRQIEEQLYGRRSSVRGSKGNAFMEALAHVDQSVCSWVVAYNGDPIRPDVIKILARTEEALLARWSLERDHFILNQYRRGSVRNDPLWDQRRKR